MGGVGIRITQQTPVTDSVQKYCHLACIENSLYWKDIEQQIGGILFKIPPI